jgi:hypothetical protein
MPNTYTGIAVNSVHPKAGAGAGFPAATGNLLLQEDGTSFFVLETGTGDIALN